MIAPRSFLFSRHPRLARICALSLLGLCLAVLLAGCGEAFNFDSEQSALDPKGPVARQQKETYDITLWVTAFLWVTVGGALLWAVWRYRARPGDENKALPKQTHGSALVEVGLIVVSAIMLVFIAVPTLQGIVYMKELPPQQMEEAVKIRATGYQWWWEFEYLDEGLITANELVLPVDRPVYVELVSGDVNHSFWLPKLAGKVDLIPGQLNDIWFQADETGTYWGQCAEFCGDSHAFMLFRAHVREADEYETWLEETLATSERDPTQTPSRASTGEDRQERVAAIQRGHELFTKNCATCHRVRPNAAGRGPNLHNIASRSTLAAGWLENNAENLHHWIQNSEEIKPGNLMYYGFPDMEGLKEKQDLLTDENVNDLVAYLGTLK